MGIRCCCTKEPDFNKKQLVEYMTRSESPPHNRSVTNSSCFKNSLFSSESRKKQKLAINILSQSESNAISPPTTPDFKKVNITANLLALVKCYSTECKRRKTWSSVSKDKDLRLKMKRGSFSKKDIF